MRASLFLFFGLIISISFNAQLPTLGYAGNIGNTGTADSRGYCVAHDLSGNSYFAGTFGGTVDFDLSASVNSKSAIGGQDIFLAKYNSAGQLQWVNHIGAAGMDIAYGINVDIFGDIYITGMLTGSADFDPSPTNTFVVSSTSGGQDSFVAKYNSNGVFIFAFNIAGSPGNDYATAITTDASGNFFITGFFVGTCNFNPFGSPFSLTVTGTFNTYLAKYNPSGNLQWAFNIQSPGNGNLGQGLCLDPSGNIFITGYFEGTTDFDPIGTLNKTSNGGEDIFIGKYANSNGALIWVNEIGSVSNDEGFSVHSDASGNVFGTGFFQGSADFDPSATPIIKTSVGGLDAYVVKFDGAGNYQSAFQIGSSGQDCGTSLYTDNSSNVYVTGYYSGTANFAPTGPPQYQNCAGVSDMFIARYNNSLNSYQFGFNTNNFNKTIGMAIDVDGIGNIYSTGLLYGSGDFDPTATNSVVAAQANSPGNDIFIAKYVQCVMPSAPTNITSTVNLVICSGNTATLSASTSSGTINWYSSPVSTVTLGSGSVFTTSALTTNTASPSTYSFYAGVTTCTYSPRILITVTVNPLPVVSISGKTLVCDKNPTILNASGAATYSWSTGSTTFSTVPTPTGNTIYSVVGTNTLNCSSTATFTVNTTIVPTPNICQVTVDSLGLNNEIFWDKTLYPSADSFIVFRETSTNVYKRIASLHKTALSMYVDTNRSIGPFNGNPNLTSYKYKLQIRDTCTNYSALSLWHQTLFFQDQLNGNFNWTNYSIELSSSPITSYNLKRRDLATGIESLVVATGTTVANDPSYNTFWPTNVKWFVDAIGFNCSVTSKVSVLKSKTKSNQSNDKNAIGIKEYGYSSSIKLYPNPASDVLNVDLNALPKEETITEIQNTLGQVVFQTKSWNQHLVINTNSIGAGVYFVNIKQNGNTIAVKKVVIDK